jgi:hypothetical protein
MVTIGGDDPLLGSAGVGTTGVGLGKGGMGEGEEPEVGLELTGWMKRFGRIAPS